MVDLSANRDSAHGIAFSRKAPAFADVAQRCFFAELSIVADLPEHHLLLPWSNGAVHFDVDHIWPEDAHLDTDGVEFHLDAYRSYLSVPRLARIADVR